MTKEREPVSIENTLRLLLGELTLEVGAEVTGRSPGYLHNLTDPDKREQLAVRDLVSLDAAHHARFGRGWLLYETIGLLLHTSGPHADAIALARHVVEIAREGGEACASLADAAINPARPESLPTALRELEQADGTFRAAIASVRRILGRNHDPPDTS